MNKDERRHFSRIFFDAPCEIRQGDMIWQSQVYDISLHGVLLQRPDGLKGAQDEDFDISIRLDEGGAAINMSVILKHENEDCLGFECRSLDLDSATHLRRLIELNLGDEALLHRELALLSFT